MFGVEPFLLTCFEERPATGGPDVRRTLHSMARANGAQAGTDCERLHVRIGLAPSAWIALLSYAKVAWIATFSRRYVVRSDAAAAISHQPPAISSNGAGLVPESRCVMADG